jgi:hypothetical protein
MSHDLAMAVDCPIWNAAVTQEPFRGASIITEMDRVGNVVNFYFFSKYPDRDDSHIDLKYCFCLFKM